MTPEVKIKIVKCKKVMSRIGRNFCTEKIMHKKNILYKDNKGKKII